jgi:endonuclease/exonuclease/phosphatase family metal-dependent hydrolase
MRRKLRKYYRDRNLHFVHFKIINLIKKSLFTFIIFQFSSAFLFAQTKIVSWNIQNFGTQKSPYIALIALQLQDADIVMIQEVQIDSDGKRAIELVENELEKTGNQWTSIISPPTNGRGTECYAYLWKSKKVRLQNQAWLEMSLDKLIDREPFLARFESENKTFLLANFHAVPRKKMPWYEIMELDELDKSYKKDNLIIAGDFNLEASNRAFNELKTDGFKAALSGIRTTIKLEEQNGEKFAHEYDNFIFEKEAITVLKSGRIDFTSNFKNLQEARKVSDHLPVYIILN